MHALCDLVRQSCDRWLLTPPGTNLVVAVSGGADSLALLHAMTSLAAALGLERIGVAHLDHGIRAKESQDDMRFVERAAAQLGLPCHTGKTAVPDIARSQGLSLEDAARQARYAFLTQVARDHGYDRIAVGHTRDDQSETVLLSLLRGAGPGGLRGMAPLQGSVVRPLLEVTRGQVLSYLAERAIEYRIDATNSDMTYTRNRVRGLLLPLLEEHFNPAIRASLARLAALVQDEEDWLAGVVDEFLGECGRVDPRGAAYAFDAGRLAAAPLGLQRRAIRAAAVLVTGTQPSPLNTTHVSDALALLTAAPGATRHLPAGLRAIRSADALRLTLDDPTTPDPPAMPKPVELTVPGSLSMPALGWELHAQLACRAPEGQPAGGWAWQVESAGARLRFTALLDADRLEWPLTVRSREPGDRFLAHGAPGERKLKEFLIDAKVPVEQRGRLPLIVDAQGRVAAVLPLRAADWALVTESTRRLLQIQGTIARGPLVVKIDGAW